MSDNKRTKRQQKKLESIFKGEPGPTAKPKRPYVTKKYGKKHQPGYVEWDKK